MSPLATADGVWAAFKALPKGAREDFLHRIVKNRRFREDLMDLAVIEARRGEKVVPISALVSERRPRRYAAR